MINAVVINGAHRSPSTCHTTASAAANLLSQHVPTRQIDVLRPSIDSLLNPMDCPELAHERHTIERTHLIVIVSPVYHAGCSGLTKLYLDRLDRRAFTDKIVGLIGVAGSNNHTLALWNSLAPVAAVMGAAHVSRGVTLATDDWDTPGVLQAASCDRLTHAIARLVLLARAHQTSMAELLSGRTHPALADEMRALS